MPPPPTPLLHELIVQANTAKAKNDFFTNFVFFVIFLEPKL